MNAAIPAVVIGGVVYTLATQEDGPAIQPGKPTAYTPTRSATLEQSLLPVRAVTPIKSTSVPATGTSKPGFAGTKVFPNVLARAQSYNMVAVSNAMDPELKKKLDAAEAYAKKVFDDANAVAKGKAADFLNDKLKLNPKLTGHEDWKAVTAIVAGAAGAAGGAALCTLTGVGAAAAALCGKIGALVGAYLGTKLADLLAKGYEEMKAWLKGKWGDLEDALGDAADAIKDAAGDALDWINPF